MDIPNETGKIHFLTAGTDWYGEARGLAMSQIAFKIAGQGSDVLILENQFQGWGGPPRHLHFEQEEWFFVLAGSFTFEVGDQTFEMTPGDSLLAPRRVPHVWAHTGAGYGSLLVGFIPAGQMEAFFREHMQANAPLPKDPAIWQAHGMQLLGPPLAAI